MAKRSEEVLQLWAAIAEEIGQEAYRVLREKLCRSVDNCNDVAVAVEAAVLKGLHKIDEQRTLTILEGE